MGAALILSQILFISVELCSHIKLYLFFFFQLNYYSTEAEFAVDKLVFKKAHFAASNIVSKSPHLRLDGCVSGCWPRVAGSNALCIVS